MGAQRSPLLRRSERETPRSRRTLRAISRSLAAPRQTQQHPRTRLRRHRRHNQPTRHVKGTEMHRLTAECKTTRALDQLGYPKHHRPAFLRAIGCLIHPNAVATAWYAGLTNRPTTTLGCRARLQWRLSLALRGVAHPG